MQQGTDILQVVSCLFVTKDLIYFIKKKEGGGRGEGTPQHFLRLS